MAASTTFYSGPASAVEIEPNVGAWGGLQDDLGECMDVTITWERTGPQTMDNSPVQTGGTGKFSCKGMSANATNNTVLEGTAGVRQDFRITVNGAYFIVKNVLVKWGFSGELNDPNKVNTFDIEAQGWTADLSDFVTLSGT